MIIQKILKIFSKSPFKYDDVIKSSSEYNAKFAKIAFDNVKKI